MRIIHCILFVLSTLASFSLNAQVILGANSCTKNKIKSIQSTIYNAKTSSQTNYVIDSNIDVSYYKLALELSYTFVPDSAYYSEKLLKGNVTIKAVSKIDTLSTVLLNLKNEGLQVDSVKISGNHQIFTHLNDLIQINLNTKIIRNEAVVLNVYYQGIPSSSGFGSFGFTSHGSPAQPVIYSLSEPFGAADWFPCKNDPSDKADSSDVWVTAPKGMITASNGVLEDTLTLGNKTTYKWQSRYPIAPYLISILTSNFDVYNTYFDYDNGKQMLINHFLFPETNTLETKQNLDKTSELLDLFTDKFGPYPFLKEKYGHANFPSNLPNMEHQTCSSISNFSRGIITHELAHQWFGDKITCESWEHIWLNEGFASYGELIEIETFNDKNFYNSIIYSLMESAKKTKGSIYVEKPDQVEEIFDVSRTYFKGALVLYMLRRIVGDSIFNQILKTYVNSTHAYGNATTEDFQKIAENTYGKDLDYFFKEWIYGYNFPKYNVGWALGNKLKNNKYPIVYTINQDTNTSTLPYFVMPVTIRMFYDDSTYTDTTFFNNQQQQDFLLYVPKAPTRISFDPDSSILKSWKTIQINVSDTLLVGITDTYKKDN